MKKLALTLLMTTLTASIMCAPVFAAETVTFNGGHIYGAQAGKPGTIKLDITNIDSVSNVKMGTDELMTYLDADGTIDKIIYTNEEGKGFSIRSIVQAQNSKDGVPVYTASASAMPSITAKTPLTAFMSYWKGDDTTQVAFAPKFYLQSDFVKTGGDNVKVYDTQPTDNWLYAPGTTENVTKAGKYLFVVHDAGGIDQSPLNVVCVNVGATNATTTNTSTVTPTPAPPTANPTQPVGWVKADNVWRYYDVHRVMQTGWFNDNGTWYYLNSDGAMKTGWLNDNGTWYYLNDNGSMASNTVIDGYTLSASGAWI